MIVVVAVIVVVVVVVVIVVLAEFLDESLLAEVLYAYPHWFQEAPWRDGGWEEGRWYTVLRLSISSF